MRDKGQKVRRRDLHSVDFELQMSYFDFRPACIAIPVRTPPVFIVYISIVVLIILQIERWWRELHERLEKFYKEHLKYLLDQCYHDPHDELDR